MVGAIISIFFSLIFFLLGYLCGKKSEQRIISVIKEAFYEEREFWKAKLEGNIQEYEIKEPKIIKAIPAKPPKKIVFANKVVKDIEKVSREYRNEIQEALSSLAHHVYPSFKVKKLSKSDFFVYRTKHLRILFKEEEDTITVLSLGKYSDFYKRLRLNNSHKVFL